MKKRLPAALILGLVVLSTSGVASAANDSVAPVVADQAIAALLADDHVLATPPLSLASLAAAIDHADAGEDDEFGCLATAVYFEARGEPIEGQLAVAQTILNRVDSGRFARSICGVVRQPGQFSFDHGRAPRPGVDWQRAQAVAHIAVNDLWHEVAPRALSFHAARVTPNWAGKVRVATIGNHIFYR
jgi:N-acetylmuramoyl-L-alanine amidase